ncbi:hypothetical protein CcrColossus_gp053 [Caulobacter phage CcrColossus]|uniref:Uncharacterized protein n=1 Tax=Caulobacter phage CcrColossus TaxID=1211640 RepID=K4JVQ1_9CAUD|nr:hypothetical protein CcrColossus_gp053 [Caulobacter phage CcrColossus]AFU87923.1 hypothetical protein CcrColossus_gp053 [Caulobacter phage CcrColossus]
MARRPTRSEQECDAFRDLLTKGFYVVNADGEVNAPGELEAALAATKLWRSELWKAFRSLDDQLNPVRKFERTGQP